jgi:hypothetical protein
MRLSHIYTHMRAQLGSSHRDDTASTSVLEPSQNDASTGVRASTHPSDHNVVVNGNSVDEKARKRRIERAKKRAGKERVSPDSKEKGKRDDHYGVGHDMPFLVPVPLYAPGGCAATGRTSENSTVSAMVSYQFNILGKIVDTFHRAQGSFALAGGAGGCGVVGSCSGYSGNGGVGGNRGCTSGGCGGGGCGGCGG